MASRAPKFLLQGINFKNNFLGSKTIQTGVYGFIEQSLKVAPIFLVVYGVSKTFYLIIHFNIDHATTYYTQEKDAFLDER